MDETLLFPSPNWFQPSVLAVSSDEWLIYGGPSKSLCILEPLPEDYDCVVQKQQGYTAHVVNRAHSEKIVCVDICPEWPEKRAVLTGSADGGVKQWSLEHSQKTLKIKPTHSHEIHSHEKEEVAGVGYCSNGYAVTVGGFGTIVKWDMNSNVAKSFHNVLKNFKPVCMACSPHIHMNVAIGTKQGVVFVLDLSGSARVIYKVRGQDDEIVKVCWCPQYEVAVRKALKESDRTSKANSRIQKIRQETEPPEVIKALDERVKNSTTTEKPVLINEKSEPVEEPKKESTSLDESGIGKTLPEDSFDETVVQDDDMFDIYKDHEADEFGHKKYQPEDIVIRVVEEKPKEDYLTECLKLKEEILKRKVQAEASVTDLVEAMGKATVDDDAEAGTSEAKAPEAMEEKPQVPKPDAPVEGKIIKGEVESSVHIHKHLLATVGKNGSIRVWSKSGKLVGSCAVSGGGGGGGGGGGAGRARGAGGAGQCGAALWLQPERLLLADARAVLLDCNPLRLDCRNKLEWRALHARHRRGLSALAAGAPRLQSPGQPRPRCTVWSAAMDRSLIGYNIETEETVQYTTCGGFIYTISACPYDARRIAMSVGDGCVRVWQADSLEADDGKLVGGAVTSYWHGVQGKVLTHAWHPSHEGLLAFATAEARVGVLNTAGATERPATVLPPALSGGVYSLSWGAGYQLYACASGELVVYTTNTPQEAPTPIAVEVEGAAWAVSAVRWAPRGLLVGSNAGAVALLSAEPPYACHAAVFIYSKMIHSLEWHPAETTNGGRSALGDLVAACSLDKANTAAILQLSERDDGSKQLSVWKSLSGHRGTVLQLMWSPHHDGWLLTTSSDSTVRIWDVVAGACTAVFGGHAAAALGASWAPRPALASHVLSGGADCALRLWSVDQHPAGAYEETKQETAVEKKKKPRKEKKEPKKEKADGESSEGESETAAAVQDSKARSSRRLLLPAVYRQTHPCSAKGPRRMLEKYLERRAGGAGAAGGAGGAAAQEEYGLEFIKLFGNMNEVNEVLDAELERHEDTGALESWSVLCILRGHVDAALQRAAARDQLDPFLLSIAPCVSFKYWKDATLLYLQQIDRLVAKREESKLNESRHYGGAVLRKVCALLGLHCVREACAALLDARLFAEAYALSRTRYMDSLAEQALRAWAQDSLTHGMYNLAAVCLLALEEPAAAAAALARAPDEDSLCLAADIAKVIGQNIFAGHIEEKRDQIKSKKDADKEKEEDLKPLPSRSELAAKDKVTIQKAIVVKDDDIDAKSQDDAAGDEKETLKQANVEADAPKPNETPVPADKVMEDDGAAPGIVKENEDKENKSDDKVTDATSPAKDEITLERAIGDTNEVIESKTQVIPGIPTTEELIKELPTKMESLMKDANQNTMHKGDGDTIQNNNKDEHLVTAKVEEVKENRADLE